MTFVIARWSYLRTMLVAGAATGALALGLPLVAQETPTAETLAEFEPVPDAAGEQSISARELQAAIESIKRRVAQQQESRETTAGSEFAAELRSSRSAITELTQNLMRLRSERDALLAEIDSRLEETTALETALANTEARAELAEERALEATRAAAESAERALSELAKRDAIITEGRAALETAEARRQALEAELGAERDRFAASAAELARAQEAMVELARKLASEQAAQAVAEEALGRAEIRLAAAEALAGEHAKDLADLHDVASRSVAEVEALGETLLATLVENEALAATLAEARTTRGELEAELVAMRRDLELSASSARSELEEVPLALVASDAVVEALNAEIAGLRRQIASLTEELVARDKQFASASADGDADALSQRLDLLQRQLDALTLENEAMASELASLRAGAEFRGPELITASLAPDEAVEHFLGQLNAVDTGDGWWMTVPEGLVFAPGSSELAPGTEGAVAQIAALIGYFGDKPLRIVGHTDSFGDAAVNRQLSLERAETVARLLVDGFAVDAARIVTEGYGDERPVASNATIDGRRANRRVEVYVQR